VCTTILEKIKTPRDGNKHFFLVGTSNFWNCYANDGTVFVARVFVELVPLAHALIGLPMIDARVDASLFVSADGLNRHAQRKSELKSLSVVIGELDAFVVRPAPASTTNRSHTHGLVVLATMRHDNRVIYQDFFDFRLSRTANVLSASGTWTEFLAMLTCQVQCLYGHQARGAPGVEFTGRIFVGRALEPSSIGSTRTPHCTLIDAP
jgi:hypothetical protein